MIPNSLVDIRMSNREFSFQMYDSNASELIDKLGGNLTCDVVTGEIVGKIELNKECLNSLIKTLQHMEAPAMIVIYQHAQNKKQAGG